MPSSSGSATMLAKFIGIPSSTQISSVSAPARISGTSVSSTSLNRRSTSQQQDRDRAERPESGLDEGERDRVAGLENRDRSADRRRLDRKHRARELPQRLVVVRIALRQRLHARAAVRRSSTRRRASFGRVSNVTGLASSEFEICSSATLQRHDEDLLRLFALRLAALRELVERSRQGASCASAPGPVLPAARLVQAVRPNRSAPRRFPRRSARSSLDSLKVGSSTSAAFLMAASLIVLILRHEEIDRHHAIGFRHLSQALLDLHRGLARRRDHVDAARAGLRVLADIEVGRDRLDLRAAQVHRVEVELQIVEQRQAGDGDAQRQQRRSRCGAAR